jgi:hypothetical protein
MVVAAARSAPREPAAAVRARTRAEIATSFTAVSALRRELSTAV